MWVAGECQDTEPGVLFKAGSLLNHEDRQTEKNNTSWSVRWRTNGVSGLSPAGYSGDQDSHDSEILTHNNMYNYN